MPTHWEQTTVILKQTKFYISVYVIFVTKRASH